MSISREEYLKIWRDKYYTRKKVEKRKNGSEIKRICKHCNTEFIIVVNGQGCMGRKYCSTECRDEATNKMVKLKYFKEKEIKYSKPQICKVCKKEFYAKTKLMYCSAKCQREVVNDKERKKRAEVAIIRNELKQKQKEEMQRQKLIIRFSILLRDKIRKEYLKCIKCNQLLPRTEENFINPNANSPCTCKQCTKENRLGTKKEGYRVCNKCGEEKPLTTEYFWMNRSIGVCKLCQGYKGIKRLTKEELLIKKREYKNEYNKIPMNKVHRNISRAIYHAIGENKGFRKWSEIVGYTKEDLFNHLEKQFQPGMTWNNYGLYGWHIDHIRPKASFNFTTAEDPEFKECWALDNLQPLWALDNIMKSDKWESA